MRKLREGRSPAADVLVDVAIGAAFGALILLALYASGRLDLMVTLFLAAL